MKHLLIILAFISIACLAPVATIKQDTKPADMTAKISHLTQVPRQMVVVNSGGLNVRSCAGTDCASLAVIQDGAIVTLTDAEPVTLYVYKWYQVVTAKGVTGWVNSKYLAVID